MAWGDDELSKFLADAQNNQKASQERLGEAYAILLELDSCFATAAKHLTNTTPVLTGVMLLRCHFAYRTAAGLALAGQVVEAFPLIRSVLEIAGYGLVICKTPTLEAVFANRHQSETDMARQKAEFRISEVFKAIKIADPKLEQIFRGLYNRAVDFGGHPNPNALFSAMDLETGDDELKVVAYGLTADPRLIVHAIKNVAQAGMTALHIFQHAFAAKFELLGIRERLEHMRRSAGL